MINGVIFANGSEAIFLHFSDSAVLRGIPADLINYEEACLIPDKESFDELTRRAFGKERTCKTINPNHKPR